MDQAINAHTRWLGKFHRAMICAVDHDPANLASDAHRRCIFGQWYYDLEDSPVRQWDKELEAAGRLHKSMHDRARNLAGGVRNQPVASGDYDEFIETAIRFKNVLRTLQFKIVNDVCLVDHLTGAWNRGALLQRLAEEFERRTREGGTSCLCMMDLDHFKNINDLHGHSAGDEVLRRVVEIAKQGLRKYDSIIRYGGEEFLLCLTNISMDEATTVLERIRSDIATQGVVLEDGTTLQVTASFGLARMCPQLSLDRSIEMADRALFCAKARGRNNVCRWDVDCQPSAEP